jgi:DNA-binding NarL/FixJ family response regulator
MILPHEDAGQSAAVPHTTDGTLSILIADDHPLFRNGLRALLRTVPEIEVVGEATTGDEAVARAAELQPDVIFMDIKSDRQ